MAKLMLVASLLVGVGACSSPAPTAQPTTTTMDPTTTTELTTTTTEPPPPTTTTSEAPQEVEEAPTTVPTTRARSAPTTAEYVAPEPEPAPVSHGPTPPEYIKQCESGGDYTAVNPTSGAGGAWQFMPGTWRSVGGTGRAEDASPEEQDYRASLLWDNGRGASHWVCA